VISTAEYPTIFVGLSNSATVVYNEFNKKICIYYSCIRYISDLVNFSLRKITKRFNKYSFNTSLDVNLFRQRGSKLLPGVSR
jgi:hypothetical protein